MKKITLELDSSILDLADAMWDQQNPEPVVQEVPLFEEGEDPPSLHDLFDVALPEGHPDYAAAVDLVFPSFELERAEQERRERELRCETPVVEVDLECAESMISTTPEGSVGDPAEEEEPRAGPSSLSPGDSPRPCRACTYHRIESGDPNIKCSLCYMHDTYYQVYSK